jgi:hypothetical protein
MMMRFRGGGVGHMSTRAATDTFKIDRDDLDIQAQQARNEEEEELDDEEMNELPRPGNVDIETIIEGANAEDGAEVDELEKLSESELNDYGYEPEIESDEDNDSEDDEEAEEDDREAGEEDDTAVDELGVLGYADY